MAVSSFTKPHRVTGAAAKRLERMLNEPSPLKNFNHKSTVVSAKELSDRIIKQCR